MGSYNLGVETGLCIFGSMYLLNFYSSYEI